MGGATTFTDVSLVFRNTECRATISLVFTYKEQN